jgi:hypothetical protein
MLRAVVNVKGSLRTGHCHWVVDTWAKFRSDPSVKDLTAEDRRVISVRGVISIRDEWVGGWMGKQDCRRWRSRPARASGDVDSY